MKINNAVNACAGLLLLLLAACGAPKPAPAPTVTAQMPTQAAAVLPATGVKYQFVTNKLLLPATQAQAESFALNLDGDAQGHPDNLFGGLLTKLTSAAPGLQLQSSVDHAINAGQMVTLHLVQADDPLNDASASWTIFQGEKTGSAPRFDGSDKFTIDPAAAANPQIAGSITNGHFVGGPGTATVQMVLLGLPVEVNLIGVRLEADFSAQGCANGKLGGGVTVDEFRGKVLPVLADGLNLIVKTDPAVADTLLQAFDTNHNATITLQELEDNFLLKLAISPDLDLLDASGKFNPGQDGVKDSLSVGLGFSCAAAVFTLPAE